MLHTTHWAIFIAIIGAMMYVDLFLVNRKAHVIRMREAAAWVAVWVAVALLFNVLVWHWMGPQKALEFFTAYIVEESLSMDNMFVFILVFRYFGIDRAQQPRVLKWGILGAWAMRLVFILIGAAIIKRFHWVLYVFGGILIWTAWKMMFHKDEELDPGKNPVLQFCKRFVKVEHDNKSDRFFVRRPEGLHATPMFASLVVLEASDLAFAVDSIPAVFGVSQDVFIVYTSNIFAILGLRSMYFLLAGAVEMFHYLKHGVSVVLLFIGLKLLLMDLFPIPIGVSLGVVAGVLAASVVVSMAFPPAKAPLPEPEREDPPTRLPHKGGGAVG